MGFWFGCEFNSNDTGCRFFDDDGYQFTNDGSGYSVGTILFEPDPDAVHIPALILLNIQYLLKDS